MAILLVSVLKRKISKMSKINVSQWKEFKITDFYQPIVVPNKIHKIDMYDDLTIPVFSAGGFQGFVDHADFKPQTHYLLFGDQTCTFFYIDYPFSVMDNVKVLKPLADISLNQSLFIQTVAMRVLGNIGYSRYWSILKKKVFQLPVDKNGDPDWHYMDEYIAKLATQAHTNISLLRQQQKKAPTVNIDRWKEFSLSHLFHAEFTDGDNKPNRLLEDDDGHPLIGATSECFGCVGYYQTDTKVFPAKSLTWDRFGHCFVQPKSFQTMAHGNVMVLKPKMDHSYEALLFVASIINRISQMRDYGYGRTLTLAEFKRSTIKLPALSDGSPDWQYMDNYISSILQVQKKRVARLTSIIK